MVNIELYKYDFFIQLGGVFMGSAILPLDEFVALDAATQVDYLKRWRTEYSLKDIREAWNFKHSAQYYMLLKKLRIYEEVVNKSDKFYPGQAIPVRLPSDPIQEKNERAAVQQAAERQEDHFTYQLNTVLSGPELAEKLERVAQFLKGEQKRIKIQIHLAADQGEQEE